jgi:hypothetical protein
VRMSAKFKTISFQLVNAIIPGWHRLWIPCGKRLMEIGSVKYDELFEITRRK